MVEKLISYKKSGVNLKKSNGIISEIKKLHNQTRKKYNLVNDFGGFAAAFELKKWKNPLVVTTCDGIGTKIKLLVKYDKLEMIGKDLVAMNINDIICTGASPILFLDYISSDKLKKKKVLRIISGMIDYLAKCNCILGGGELAEMPLSVSQKNNAKKIDVSGFCVGVCEKKDLIKCDKISSSDAIVGIPSSGFHANGFSLIRKVIIEKKIKLKKSEISALLEPTRLYWDEFIKIKESNVEIKGLAHITGGGIKENIRRIIKNNGAKIDLPFKIIEKIPFWHQSITKKILKHVSKKEIKKTFNMGIGFVVILSKKDAQKVLEKISDAYYIGKVTTSKKIKINFKK